MCRHSCEEANLLLLDDALGVGLVDVGGVLGAGGDPVKVKAYQAPRRCAVQGCSTAAIFGSQELPGPDTNPRQNAELKTPIP